MRGKEERARSGRIPQAFGRGCYGYTYNPDTGRREIDPYQAAIVRRNLRTLRGDAELLGRDQRTE